MSSSTFEVTETENETGKDLNFGLEACEENGISAQVDGEVQKDHTYTKDPDSSDEEESTEKTEQVESDKADASPEKRTPKGPRAIKRNNPRNAKVKKDVSPKKEAPSPRKAKAKKEVLTEESNKSDDNSKSEKSAEKNATEEQSKPLKRGKKRKVEEKENVIDRSIVEEVQNINEGESVTEESSESPTKKKNTSEKAKSKKASKSASAVEDKEDNKNLPDGWVRKVVVRKSGKTAGQVDIYIYSPDGIKFRSKPDVAAYLARTKSNLKIEDFNFSKKNVSDDSTTKPTAKREKATSAVKPKSSPEKKKVKESSTPKKGSKLLVKLNFSPKSKKGKNAKKVPEKQEKPAKSSARKVKASGSNTKVSKKKKTA